MTNKITSEFHQVVDSVREYINDIDQSMSIHVGKSILENVSNPAKDFELCHGTDVDSWKPVASQGNFGRGVYLADINTAEGYGEKVHKCGATISKPFLVLADYIDGTNFETPSLIAIFQALGLRGLKEYFNRLNIGEFYPSEEITNVLSSLGYDSIIAIYSDSSFELVVFDSDKVTSELLVVKD